MDPINKERARTAGIGFVRVVEDDGTVDLLWSRAYENLGVDGIVRLRADEHRQAGDGRSCVTHFNLQMCHHRVGAYYALVQILRPGWFDGVREEPPLVTFRGALRAICTSVRNRVPYESLAASDLEHAFADAATPEQVKSSILRRYGQSMPHLSPEQISELGVSVSKFTLVRTEHR